MGSFMKKLEIDREWYIVEWFVDGMDEPHYSVPYEHEHHAIEVLKAKRNQGLEASLYYNAEISIKVA